MEIRLVIAYSLIALMCIFVATVIIVIKAKRGKAQQRANRFAPIDFPMRD